MWFYNKKREFFRTQNEIKDKQPKTECNLNLLM